LIASEKSQPNRIDINFPAPGFIRMGLADRCGFERGELLHKCSCFLDVRLSVECVLAEFVSGSLDLSLRGRQGNQLHHTIRWPDRHQCPKLSPTKGVVTPRSPTGLFRALFLHNVEIHYPPRAPRGTPQTIPMARELSQSGTPRHVTF
jgi:hypothetical protein